MRTCPTCGIQYPSHVRICSRDGSVLDGDPAAGTRQIGTTLEGKYKLEQLLGEGGMGTVYRATHVMLGKSVAVKVVKPELVTSPEMVRRFQREARAATNLTHPNIVGVYDLGQAEDGTLFIVMELVEGPSLKEVIRTTGPLPALRIVRLLGQVTSALSQAHARGVVHRDLKPQNITVAIDPQGREAAKLLDFGIAKTLDDGTTQLTRQGFALGTPHYMSPEQAMGTEVDARSDLYSLGVILYEMLTGEVPFGDKSTSAVLIKHMNEPPVPPSERRPDLTIPAKLEAIALRCLHKEPSARFQSADEISQALLSVAVDLGDPTTLAATVPLAGLIDSASRMTRTPSDRQNDSTPTMPAAAVPPVSAIDADSTPTQASPPIAHGTSAGTRPTVHSAAAEPPPSSPTSSQRRSSRTPLAAGLLLVVAAIAALLFFLGRAGPPTDLVEDEAPVLVEEAVASAVASAVAEALSEADTVAGVAAGADTESSTPDGSTPDGPAPDLTPAGPFSDPVLDGPSQPPATAPPPPRGEEFLPPPGGARGRFGARRGGAARGQFGTANRPGGQGRSLRGGAGGSQLAPAPGGTLPIVPAVFLDCRGAVEVCPAVQAALVREFSRIKVPVVPVQGQADVVLLTNVTNLEERVEQQFETTFVVRTYAIDISGNAVRLGEVVPMPPPRTMSFDARFGPERAMENARILATAAVRNVAMFWKARLSR